MPVAQQLFSWLLILPLLCCLVRTEATAQVRADSLQKPISTRLQAGDSLHLISDEPLKSPRGAIFRSLALPGWGQFYTEHYLKSGIAFLANGTMIYSIYSYHTRFQDLEDVADPEQRDLQAEERLRLKGRRNDFGWLFGVLYLLTMADAYVDAHLFGFNDIVNVAVYPAGRSSADWMVGVNIRL